MSNKSKTSQTIEEKRAQALKVIETAEILQQARWGTLYDSVLLAGNSVIIMRQDVLEDRRAEQGYPLWLSVVISLALAAIPVEALAVSGLTKLIAFSRQSLGRIKVSKGIIIGVDRTSQEIIEAIGPKDKDFGVKSMIRYLLENDEKTVQIINLYKPEVGNAIQSTLNSAAGAGISALFGPSGAIASRQKQSRATDPPQVVIQRAFFDWIRASQLAESLAISELKERVRVKKDIKIDEIEKVIASFEAGSPVAPYEGPDVQYLFQQFVEKCIWCTTYDFLPKLETLSKEVEREPISLLGQELITLKERVTKEDVVVPPDYGEKFWDRLTSHFIENLVTGETYKDSKQHSGANEKHIKQLEFFRGPDAASALRLAYHFHQLRLQLTKQNRDAADLLLKAFSK